jgi:hypothetical protein
MSYDHVITKMVLIMVMGWKCGTQSHKRRRVVKWRMDDFRKEEGTWKHIWQQTEQLHEAHFS